MAHIEQSEYEKCLTRISEILSGIVEYAGAQALTRCPYKNAKGQCTAKFGCRYQRKPPVMGDRQLCTHNDTLDYRSAWESDPQEFEELRTTLKASKQERDERDRQRNSSAVQSGEKQCVATVGKTIFDHADVLGVKVPTSCGRMGHCHECIVEVRRGLEALSPQTEAEAFLNDNYRLACQAVVETASQDVEFNLLRRSPQILTTQTRRDVQLDPVVTRQGENVCYDGEAIDQYRGHLLGLAVDLGTTTVVAELLDLETGRSLATASFENPQRFGGSDVLNRISYDSGRFQGELHRAIINSLNTEIREMCQQLGIDRHSLYEILVVGNSTMRDLFFDLDVQAIGQRPYKSLTEHEYRTGQRETTSLTELARKLRIYANKNARVFGVPLIASHVGGDVVADLLTIDIESQDEVVMLVDVGTNTEVVIGHKDQLITASCPAGPAFEGGLVKFGMPGCEGAIESIRYEEGHFQCRTIGDVEPQGICGSGLIDLLAELRRNDLMTPKGVFAEKAYEFTIVPEQGITFSRQDASHLAQAKSANHCGQVILMREFGIGPEQISKLYLAGGFANYVDPAAAIEIGFLPRVPAERIVPVGNAASSGAREMLLSGRKRQSIERLIKTITHIELETTPDFFDVFVEGCQF